jgi:hypothetical protein
MALRVLLALHLHVHGQPPGYVVCSTRTAAWVLTSATCRVDATATSSLFTCGSLLGRPHLCDAEGSCWWGVVQVAAWWLGSRGGGAQKLGAFLPEGGSLLHVTAASRGVTMAAVQAGLFVLAAVVAVVSACGFSCGRGVSGRWLH